MKSSAFLLVPILALVSAQNSQQGISVQLFNDIDCSGNPQANVQSQAGSVNATSGCISPGFFATAQFVGTPANGFLCKFFSDLQCTDANLIANANGPVGQCFQLNPPGNGIEVNGQSVECFCEACISNPFFLTTALLTVGTTSQ